MVRQRSVFSGSVQGVGFRATTASIATGFHITGWVRNDPDGRVTCEAQGDAGDIEAFFGAVKDRMARNIRASESMDLPIAQGEQGFRISR